MITYTYDSQTGGVKQTIDYQLDTNPTTPMTAATSRSGDSTAAVDATASGTMKAG